MSLAALEQSPLNTASQNIMFLVLAQASLFFVFVHLLCNALQPGLVSVPGPFVAKFTDLWRLYKLWQWKFKEDLPALHEKYDSTLIRIGPRTFSCSDPPAVELIYGFHTEVKKVRTILF